MALEDFLLRFSPELAAALQRVQGRGGKAKQAYARRRGLFLAVLTFLSGWVAGRGQSRQSARRSARIARRQAELQDPNHPSYNPEWGECCIAWTSDEEVEEAEGRSRSPAQLGLYSALAAPRPSSAPEPTGTDSGVFLAIDAGDYKFPVVRFSKKQSSVARSTPEAGAISMAAALFGETLNIQDTLSLLLQKSVPVVFQQDNEALIKIFKAGYSPKLGHVGRVHRINVASMAEVLAEDGVSCEYCPTQAQIATSEWPHMLQQLCLELPVPATALVVVKHFVAPAEHVAKQFAKRIDRQDLVPLLSYLPSGVADMASDQTSAHSFTVGAFSRGTCIAGVRTFTRLLPNVSKVLCRFVRSPMHRDSRNKPGSTNLLCGFTPDPSAVWLHDPEGCDLDRLGWNLQGTYLTSPCVLNPRRRHCTTPRSKSGPDMRIVTVAFTIREPEMLSSADADHLREFGFNF